MTFGPSFLIVIVYASLALCFVMSMILVTQLIIDWKRGDLW